MKEFLILFSWALLVSSMRVKAGQIEVTPENYVQAKGTPYDNPDYAYTLLIPKDFKSEKLTSKSSELSTTKLTPLGSFYSYIDSETEKLLINIRISGILSNGVVDPAGVFNRVLTKQGDVDLINVEPVDASSAVGYMTRKIEGNDYVEYSKVNVYGTQIFILQCFLPKSSESEYVDKVCKVALDTFRMVNHKKSEANKTSSLQYFKFAGETLSLPDKWQKPTSNNPKGEDSYLDYMLYNRDNTIALGWVRIRYYTKNTFLEYLDSPDELPILIEETVKDEINSIG